MVEIIAIRLFPRLPPGSPLELGGEVLGQGVGVALPAHAVVRQRVQHPEHPAVHLQRRHTQRRAAQLVHQHVAEGETWQPDVNRMDS